MSVQTIKSAIQPRLNVGIVQNLAGAREAKHYTALCGASQPDLQNDVYYLYPITTTNFATISKEIAHIPDYKTSVLMNKLFRNIKENINLDSLEESDEEDEFENIQIDKFVDLNKILKMRCIFNYKFKKWIPISVV